MPKIQVLIVDDNQDTRDGTRRLLEYEDDIEIVDFAENGAIAIDKVRELHPDVILMDINMPVMDGITATQQIMGEFPRTQIIVVSVQDDTNYMREAIRAGAVDFVAKPISADELAEAIRRAYAKIPSANAAPPHPTAGRTAPGVPSFQPTSQDKHGHVITVLGPKGGVGKTTVAVNLGVGLIRSDPDKSILVIDGNPYFGDVGVFLNTRGQYSLLDMASMAEVPEEIDNQSVDTILVSHESGVKLLIAPSTPAEMSQVSMRAMLNMFDYLRTRFDYIIVDTSTTFDDVLAASIQASDRIIIVAAPTMPALKDTRVMMSELSGFDYEMGNVVIVLNMHDPEGRITTEQIEKFLRKSAVVEVPFDPTVSEALNRGVPLIQLDAKRVPSVRPLLDLVHNTREAFEKIDIPTEPETEQKQRRGGLFRMLGNN